MLTLAPRKYWKDMMRQARIGKGHKSKAMVSSQTIDKPTIKSFEYDTTGHARQCVERSCESADIDESSFRKMAIPCIDEHQISQEEFQTKGKLHKECARCVLKCLFLARIGRPYGP